MCDVSRDLLKFWDTNDSISSTLQDKDIVANNTNRKSYVAYGMAALPMPLNDPEGHFCCLKPFNSHTA